MYGADPGAVDKSGRTASDYARQSGHGGLANRIDSSQFELSDRLSFFLTGKRPDHSSGQHFLVPEFAEDKADPLVEAKKVAKRKMQGLNNAVFEELCVDVYDEVDRRETDQVWASTVPKNSTLVCLPFLPVNPDYGTTRNQGRQKLARLDAREFAVLVRDVLKEIRRRQTDINKMGGAGGSPLREGLTLRGAQKVVQTKSLPVGGGGVVRLLSGISDDEPIYDHVASDDDYYHIPETPTSSVERSVQQQSQQQSDVTPKRPHSSSGYGGGLSSSSAQSSPSKGGGGSKMPANLFATPIRTSEYQELKAQLESSEVRVQRLLDTNEDMRSEITRLSVAVSKLVAENDLLRNSQHLQPQGNGMLPATLESSSRTRNSPAGSRPMQQQQQSLYEQPLQQQRRDSNASSNSQQHGQTNNNSSSRYSTNSPRSNVQQQQQPQSHYYDPYECSPNSSSAAGSSQHSNSLPPSYASLGQQQQQHEYADPRDLPPPPPPPPAGGGSSLPSQEEVVRRTEAITRCIQELLISAKDEQFDAFIPCSERIVRAVTDMVILFPDEDEGSASGAAAVDPGITSALSSLTAAAAHFETECRILIVRSQSEPLQQSFVTQQVIQCAFDIAKSTKQLVAMFQ